MTQNATNPVVMAVEQKAQAVSPASTNAVYGRDPFALVRCDDVKIRRYKEASATLAVMRPNPIRAMTVDIKFLSELLSSCEAGP
jgi:hypothetical protein